MAIKYGIFFSYGGRVLRLPINPEELPVTREGDNSEYNVLEIGAITIPRTPKQKEVTIESYFPARVDSSVLTPNSFLTPEEYINFFQDAMDNQRVITYTPVRYDEDGASFGTSDAGFKCLVQSFTTTEKGGETGDFYYSLTIREYRDYSPMTASVKTSATTGESVVVQTSTRQVPKSEIVVGSTVIANGNYFYTSYGATPSGKANGIRCIVFRIADTDRSCPYYIKTESGSSLGWIAKSALTVTE